MEMEDWECIPPLVDGKRYSFTDVSCKQYYYSISNSMIAKIGTTRNVDITLGTEYDGTPFVVCYLTTYPFQLLKVSDSTSDANPGDTNIALIIVIVVVVIIVIAAIVIFVVLSRNKDKHPTKLPTQTVSNKSPQGMNPQVTPNQFQQNNPAQMTPNQSTQNMTTQAMPNQQMYMAQYQPVPNQPAQSVPVQTTAGAPTQQTPSVPVQTTPGAPSQSTASA